MEICASAVRGEEEFITPTEFPSAPPLPLFGREDNCVDVNTRGEKCPEGCDSERFIFVSRTTVGRDFKKLYERCFVSKD